MMRQMKLLKMRKKENLICQTMQSSGPVRHFESGNANIKFLVSTFGTKLAIVLLGAHLSKL